MKFSVITSTYNAGNALPATASSLRLQTCRDFEWIIVDGASSDNTREVVRGLGELVDVFVSEKDTGIFNAWNKALARVRGEWVLFLGAGDELFGPGVLADIAGQLDSLPGKTTMLYGSVELVDPHGRAVGRRDETWGGIGHWWSLRKPKVPSHQAVFQKSSIFESGFRFDETLRICADTELMLRELVAGTGWRTSTIVSKFVTGGISHVRENRYRKLVEFSKIFRKLRLVHRRPLYVLSMLAAAGGLYVAARCGGWLRNER